MEYRLKKAVALKICADQVEAIVTRPLLRHKEWSVKKLFLYLTELGLDYTNDEVAILITELGNRGILEAV